MKKWLVFGLAVVAAALVPGGAIGGAVGETGDDESSIGAFDIVYAEASGSTSGNLDITVFGTLQCEGAGPLNLDMAIQQPSTGGAGAGANNGQTCPAPGQTIKWVMTAAGTSMLIDDEIVIEVLANGSTIATATETKVLHWGLHAGS